MNSDERIRALALLRASLTGDGETVTAIMSGGEVSLETVSHLVGFAVSVMQLTVGTDLAVQTIDRAMAEFMAQPPK